MMSSSKGLVAETVSDTKNTVNDLKECLDKFKSKPKLVLGALEELVAVGMISYKVLKETGIGKTVNGFRKCEGEVGVLARRLVSDWKETAAAAIQLEKVNKEKTKNDSEKPDSSVDSSTINEQLSERYKDSESSMEVKVKTTKPEHAKPTKGKPSDNDKTTVVNKTSAVNDGVRIKHEKPEHVKPKDKSSDSGKKTAVNDKKTVVTDGVKVEQEKDNHKLNSGEKSRRSKHGKRKSDDSVDQKKTNADTNALSFEEAMLGSSPLPQSAHKKKAKPARIKAEPSPDTGSSPSVGGDLKPSTRTGDLNSSNDTSARNKSKHVSPDTDCADLAKLHEGISFSKSSELTTTQQLPTMKKTVPLESKTAPDGAKKKTIGLEDYKRLAILKKERRSSDESKAVDNPSDGRKRPHSGECEDLADVSPPKTLKSEPNSECPLSLSELQSNLNHLLRVVQSQTAGNSVSVKKEVGSEQSVSYDKSSASVRSSQDEISLPKSSDGINANTSSDKHLALNIKSEPKSKSPVYRHSVKSEPCTELPDREKLSDKRSLERSSDRHHSKHGESSNGRASSDKTISDKGDRHTSKESSRHHSSSKTDRHNSDKRSDRHNSSKSSGSSHANPDRPRFDKLSDRRSSNHSSDHVSSKSSERRSSEKTSDRENHTKTSNRQHSVKTDLHSSDGIAAHHGSDKPSNHHSTDRKTDRHNSEKSSGKDSSKSSDRHSSDKTKRSDSKSSSKHDNSKVLNMQSHARSSDMQKNDASPEMSSSDKHKSSHQKHKKHKKEKRHSDSKHSHHRSSHSNAKTEERDGRSHGESGETRKRKMSGGGVDGSNGESFGDMLSNASCAEPPKKKKSPSLEQKIAKTVAKAPLPQSYLNDLPELLTDYKPLPKISQGFESRHATAASSSKLEFSDIKASSRSDAVYSGRRRGHTTMLPLTDLCTIVLGNNIDEIGYVGGVPYSMLEPVLRKATPRQLLTIEDYNTSFTEHSDPLWKEHCARDFKGQKLEEHESWRELYLRKYEEREKKFEMLQSKIAAKEQQKQSEARRSKVAYAMSSAPKPPRDVRRQQARYGTGSGSVESTARAAAIMKNEIVAPRSSSSNTSRDSRTSAAKTISLPPLMKKAKKFMSKLNR